MPWNYLFGPVPSRRLGQSLGVDIIPSKLCTLDCVYCEVGRTDKRGIARKEYYPVEEILAEVSEALRLYPRLDHITISGSGEPTLHSGIGRLIRGIKSMTPTPVAVLTNGTLLNDPAVREDLLDADVVSPSLDAVTQEVFERIDRPHPDLCIDEIVAGLKDFRAVFRGELWLEILFVHGINDGDAEVHRMSEVIAEINPDRVQLNTVIRPPAELFAAPVPESRMREIQQILGSRTEIIGLCREAGHQPAHAADRGQILALLRRRAMKLDEMAAALDMHRSEVENLLRGLIHDGLIREFDFEGSRFFQSLENPGT